MTGIYPGIDVNWHFWLVHRVLVHLAFVRKRAIHTATIARAKLATRDSTVARSSTTVHQRHAKTVDHVSYHVQANIVAIALQVCQGFCFEIGLFIWFILNRALRVISMCFEL